MSLKKRSTICDLIVAFAKTCFPNPVSAKMIADNLGRDVRSSAKLACHCVANGRLRRLPKTLNAKGEANLQYYVYVEPIAIARNPHSKTIFNEIDRLGHDEDFQPAPCRYPTQYPPGSPEKIETLRRRVELGQHIWHDDDVDDSGRPRSLQSRSTESAA